MCLPEVVPSLQVPVVSQPRGSEYLITSSPHPCQGGGNFNSTPQAGNQSVGSQNSSGWSSGFTSRIQDSSTAQDVPLDKQQGFRMSRSPSPIRAPEVQVSDFDSFQWIFANTQASLEQIHFSLNSLVDIAQTRIFENNYRALDNHVDYLITFIGLHFNYYNIPEMISSIRALQINLEH